MKACDVRRAWVATVVAAVVAVSTGGCQGETAKSGSAGSDPPGLNGVHATVVQQRIDEGTRRIGIEVSVDAGSSLHVVAVQLRSAGFRAIPPTSKDTTFAPRQIIDLTTTYGKARCKRADPSRDAFAALSVTEADGTVTTYDVPVTGAGIGLIRRLHDSECAKRLLRRAAPVSYARFTRARLDGRDVLKGALTFERPATGGSGEVVLLDSLSGSVLFDVRPLVQAKPGLVARLAAAAQQLRVPVAIGSSARCDQHARSQSTQTFLFSAFVRVGSSSPHREIIVPPPGLQRQALALLDDVC